MNAESDQRQPDMGADDTALVLGGGGVLGAAEVGMLRAIVERGICPDVVIGSSVGALNGALFAADPTPAGVQRIEDAWTSKRAQTVFGGTFGSRVSTLVRHGTYLHSNTALRALIDEALPDACIEDLPVRFECVAASIERAGAHWFDRGPVADAVLASCAVPGLLPAVEVDGEHFLDGGLVHSVPVGRAMARQARRVFVLQVGRLEQPLSPPRKPWEVGLVAFEIVRRHRFSEDLATVSPGVKVHVLPSGGEVPFLNLRYRRSTETRTRIDAAYEASRRYLDGLEGLGSKA